MSTKTEIMIWDQGVKSFEKSDLNGAISAWKEIADYSKIHFNIAVVFIRGKYWDDAIDALTRAIACDKFMAIAFYIRGYCHFILHEYEEANNDYSLGIEHMRGNDSVDYTQLGLAFKLNACELYFNRALCLFAVNGINEANADLNTSLKRSLGDGGILDPSIISQAVQLQQDSANILLPFSMPLTIIYRPSEYKIKNSDKVDYLGKSKVIASADGDSYKGFSGTLIRKKTLQSKGFDSTPSPITEASPLVKRSATITIRNRSPTAQRSATVRARIPSESDIGNSAPKIASARKYSVGQLNLERKSEDRVYSGSGILIPKRKMSKMSSETKMQQSFDQLSISSSGSGTTATDKIKLKCHFRGEARMVLVSFNVHISDLAEKICKKFGVDDMRVTYRDEDGEMVSITDQEDLVFAMACHGMDWGDFGSNNKMEVFCIEVEK